MSFKVLIHNEVLEKLSGLDQRTRSRVLDALRALRDDPITPRPGADIRRLRVPEGRNPLYRLRAGKCRAIYLVEEGRVIVTELVHRSQACREL